MSSNITLDSTDSDVFYVEQKSNESSPQGNNSQDILISTERSEHHARRMPSISTIASPQPHIFTINVDSNEPTLPYGFGRQFPIVPPSLHDLNLPPNPFNILATMAVVHPIQNTHDDNDSPQSPDPSELSSISTPPMNVSAFNRCETSYTSTDDNTFYKSDEPRQVYWDLASDDDLGSSVPRNPSIASSPCDTPPPPRAQKRKLNLGMSFPEEGGVSQQVCEACGQMIPSKDIPGPSNRN